EGEQPDDLMVPRPPRVSSPNMPHDDEKWYIKQPKASTNESSSVDLSDAAGAADQARKDADSAQRRMDEADALTEAMYPDDGSSRVNLGMEPRVSGILGHSVVETAGPLSRSPTPVRPKQGSRPQMRFGHSTKAWWAGAAVGFTIALSLAVALWSTGWFTPSRKAAPATSQQTAASLPTVAEPPK